MATATCGGANGMTSGYNSCQNGDSTQVNEDQQPKGNGETIKDESSGDGQEPVIDIIINNVVCSFSIGCQLNLRDIAMRGNNVEFRKENSMVTMKLRRPMVTASIWSSGKVTCTGSTSEDDAKRAGRRVARVLQKLKGVDGKHVRFLNFRVVNVLGTCAMPFAINIIGFSEKYKNAGAQYEPELHPGVTYRIAPPEPKATLKVFSTGSITVTAPRVTNVQTAIEHIYPRVEEFGKERLVTEQRTSALKKARLQRSSVAAAEVIYLDSDDSEDFDDDDMDNDSDEFESDSDEY